MDSYRIKELHEQTACSKSVSVRIALLQVWNECQQEHNEQLLLHSVSKSIAKKYAEFCVRCDRDGLPLLELDDYIKQYCC